MVVIDVDGCCSRRHTQQEQSSINNLYHPVHEVIQAFRYSLPAAIYTCTVPSPPDMFVSVSNAYGVWPPIADYAYLPSRDTRHEVCLHNHLVCYPHHGWDRQQRISAQLVHPFPIQPTKNKRMQERQKAMTFERPPERGLGAQRAPPTYTAQSTKCQASRATTPGGPALVRCGPARIRRAASRPGPRALRGGWSVTVSSQFQEANWKVELVEGIPDPDVMPDLDADAAASAGQALMLGPARPPKTTGKNPISTPPRVTCIAHGDTRMNAMAVPAFDALFGTRVLTCRKSGRRLLTFSLGADEDDG